MLSKKHLRTLVIILAATFLPVPSLAHQTSHQGLQVTDTHVQAPFDKVPRLCRSGSDVAGGPLITSTQNGNFSDPATWGGAVPAANARIHIQHTVTYDQNSPLVYQCIEIQDGGHLQFSTTSSTQLRLNGELLVMPQGKLTIGTAANPIPAGVQHNISFTSAPLQTGTPASPGPDPQQYGKGLIVTGDLSLHGSPKPQTFIRVDREPKAGDTDLLLLDIPTGWQIGDEIVLPDTRQTYDRTTPQWEVMTISAINGRTITLSSPLAFDHLGARDADTARTPSVLPDGTKLLPHVANLSRNITFRSEEATNVSRRAHGLLLHRAQVDVRYTRFQSMGRTRAQAIDNSKFDAQGNLTHVGTNQIGRYPFHTHHVWGPRNPSNSGYQFTMVGNTIDDGLKWSLTIHDSHFGLIKDTIVYHADGAGIVTEDGSEYGNEFINNFVVRTDGPDPEAQGFNLFDVRLQGIEGAAFWFRGPMNTIVGNKAANAFTAAVNFMSGVQEDDQHISNVRIPLIRGADIFDDTEAQAVNGNQRTFIDFSDIEGYGNMDQIFEVWVIGDNRSSRGDSTQPGNKVSNIVGWHTSAQQRNGGDNGTVVGLYYVNNLELDGVVYRGDPSQIDVFSGKPPAIRHGRNNVLIIRNADLQGAGTGLSLVARGPSEQTILEDSFLANYNNVAFTPRNQGGPGHTVTLRNVRFAGLPGVTDNTADQSKPPTNISVGDVSQEDVVSRHHDPYAKHQHYVFGFNGNAGENYQIFYESQASNYTINPNWTDGSVVAYPQCAALTNRACFQQHGGAIAGAVAPCDTVDGDDCSAARARAQTLGIHNGLVFPFDPGNNNPSIPGFPPRLSITQPSAGSTQAPGQLSVRYAASGDLTEVDHAHFQLDNLPEVIDQDFDGHLSFDNLTPGSHTIRGYLARADHSKVDGTDVSISFTVAAETSNRSPIISVAQNIFNVVVGQTLQFVIGASDPDGDEVTVTIPNLDQTLPGATLTDQ